MGLFFAHMFGQRDMSRVILHVDSKSSVGFIDFRLFHYDVLYFIDTSAGNARMRIYVRDKNDKNNKRRR